MRIDERTADAKAMDWDMLCIKHHGTVYLITDAEWDEIQIGYNDYRHEWLTKGCWYDEDSEVMPFSQYLNALISLTGEGRK